MHKKHGYRLIMQWRRKIRKGEYLTVDWTTKVRANNVAEARREGGRLFEERYGLRPMKVKAIRK